MSGIFISYRRSDSPDATGRIYDRLVTEFGKVQVFKDVDSIPLGRDFRGHLNDIVGNCGVMLAIVGPHWTEARNPAGKRRLEDPEDFVRIELETALARDIPVVPVLVGHAQLPGAAELPASLGALVFRQSIAVRPDPDFHNDATRLVTALRAILDPEAAAAEQAAAALAQAAAARSAQGARRLGWMLASVAIVGMALLAVPAIRYLRLTPPPAPPEMRVDINTPATSQPDSFALSPDGRQIVFVASDNGASRLWLRSLASTTAQPLAGTEGATDAFWSPDSRSIGFFAHGALKHLDLGGGAPYTLAPARNGAGGTWNAAGVILFAPSQIGSPLMRVSATGGAAQAATILMAGQTGQADPFFLPDGHHFLFTVAGSPAAGGTGIYLGDLTGGAPTRLTNGLSQALYLPTGWMLWVRDGALVAQRLNVGKAALTGAPVTLASGLLPAAGPFIPASVSATGLVAYRVGAVSQGQLTWFDRTGTARGSVGAPDDALYAPRVAPDGRRLVVARTTAQGFNIWLLDGARMSRLTFGATIDFDPMWSPDGMRIVFTSNPSGTFDLYQTLVNGSVGDEQPLLSAGQVKIPAAPTSWSPDGRFLLYTSGTPQTGADLWVLAMAGAHTPSVFLKTPFDEEWGTFSPDGRWVAYQSNESGRFEIYVRPFHPPGAKDSDAASGAMQWQVSTGGGIYPAWQRDGKEIDYIDPSGAMMAAPITARGAQLAAGTPVTLFQTRIVGGGENSTAGREYDVAPDGRFLINTVSESAVAPITLIQNWNPEATAQ